MRAGKLKIIQMRSLGSQIIKHEFMGMLFLKEYYNKCMVIQIF